ncbi:NUDIX hydrolase, partial [Mycobacterium tuberculosis]
MSLNPESVAIPDAALRSQLDAYTRRHP